MLFPCPGMLEDGVGLTDAQSIASMPVCYGICKLWLMKKNHQQGHNQRPAPHLSVTSPSVIAEKGLVSLH